MGLQGFEKRLERLVEGAFARAFRSEVRPVELGRRIARAMDQGLNLGVRGESVAPNYFEVRLSVEDFDQLEHLAESLAHELAEAAEEHARDEGYQLKGPAVVDLVGDPKAKPGQFRVNVAVKPNTRATRSAGWLVLVDGRRLAVTDQPVVIGRLPDCDVPVADTNVSRRHAEVRMADGIPAVVDLQSTNGTKVNGRGVPPDGYGIALADGDEIRVGTAVLRYESAKRG